MKHFFYTMLLMIKRTLHANLFLILGIYTSVGLFFLTLIAFGLSYDSGQSLVAFLPPSWMFGGDMSHFLGTDNQGQDLFYRLISAYKISLLLMAKSTLFVVILSLILNACIYFFRRLGALIFLCLHVLNSIPPILTVIGIALFLHTSNETVLLAVGLAYLPHFMNDIHQDLTNEKDKLYVVADRLEGMSEKQLFFYTIFPNVLPKFLKHLVTLISQILLGVTLVTFFKVIDITSSPDLGFFMHEMMGLFLYNPWPIYASGIVIVLTIMSINFIVMGLDRAHSKAIED